MKKTALILALALTLTACGNSLKWEGDIEVPEEIRAEYEQSIADHKAQIEEDPENFDAHFQIAYYHQLMGEYRPAVEYYKKALELAPADFASLNNIADTYESVGDYDMAAEYITQLYEIHSNMLEVVRDTVRIHAKAERFEEAENIVNKFKELKSGDSEFQKIIKDMQDMLNNYRENS